MITAAAALGPVAAIGLFGGVPLLIFATVAFVVSLPARRRLKQLRREIEAGRAQQRADEPVDGGSPESSTQSDRNVDADRA